MSGASAGIELQRLAELVRGGRRIAALKVHDAEVVVRIHDQLPDVPILRLRFAAPPETVEQEVVVAVAIELELFGERRQPLPRLRLKRGPAPGESGAIAAASVSQRSQRRNSRVPAGALGIADELLALRLVLRRQSRPAPAPPA